jgi:hypothetical protein
MTFQILAMIASAVALFVGGIATHGWLTRQKTSAIRADAIHGAVDVLLAAANTASDDAQILAATQRKQATALALQHALERLTAAKAA